MSENHFCNLRPIDAGGFEILPQFARSRHEAVARTHINKNELLPDCDQCHVGW
jgi:hypothetical protein